jgi:hypothetical protein
VSTIQAILVFAAEEAGHSTDKTFYYVAGGLLTLWALVVSAIGISRHDKWPATDGAKRAVMGLTAVFVAVAMASAIVTS